MATVVTMDMATAAITDTAGMLTDTEADTAGQTFAAVTAADSTVTLEPVSTAQAVASMETAEAHFMAAVAGFMVAVEGMEADTGN